MCTTGLEQTTDCNEKAAIATDTLSFGEHIPIFAQSKWVVWHQLNIIYITVYYAACIGQWILATLATLGVNAECAASGDLAEASEVRYRAARVLD